MKPEQRDDIRKAADAAIKGPWEIRTCAPAHPDEIAVFQSEKAEGYTFLKITGWFLEAGRPTLEFIAGARQWIPELLDRVDALENRIRGLQRDRANHVIRRRRAERERDRLLHLVDALKVKIETLEGLSLDRPSACDMLHQPPFDFAHCQTHDTTFALGDKCEWDGVESISQHLMSKADEQRGRAVRAEMNHDQEKDRADRLAAQLQEIRDIVNPHHERQLGRARKFGRQDPDCVCEQCRIAAILNREDIA